MVEKIIKIKRFEDFKKYQPSTDIKPNYVLVS